MGRILQHRLVQKKFEGPHHEASLNLLVAANHLRGMLDRAFADARLTPGQYNLLRILNGVYPRGWSRGEIGRRLLERAPDLTRMIDRLVARGLVRRTRSAEDARQSIAVITPRGRELLRHMHPRLDLVTGVLRARLTARDAKQLSALCEKLYGPDLGAEDGE